MGKSIRGMLESSFSDLDRAIRYAEEARDQLETVSEKLDEIAGDDHLRAALKRFVYAIDISGEPVWGLKEREREMYEAAREALCDEQVAVR